MKVLLRKNIAKLGLIGDVVQVKPGYARNYLLPQGLATQPTEANLRAVKAERQRYLQELARQRGDLEARASSLNGREVTIAARANPEGHLYGSVGPAQIVAALAEDGIFLQPENIVVDPAIRRLDKYEVAVRFAEDITALIYVWVVPLREGEAEEGEAPEQTEAAPAEKPGAEGDQQPDQQPDPQAGPPDPLGEEGST